MTPLAKKDVKELEAKRSAYGCGSQICVRCYPVQYACEYCSANYPLPIANGEVYSCPKCDWLANGENA